jgi:hypothetical protein
MERPSAAAVQPAFRPQGMPALATRPTFPPASPPPRPQGARPLGRVAGSTVAQRATLVANPIPWQGFGGLAASGGGGEPPRRPFEVPKSHSISYLWEVDWEGVEEAEAERTRAEKDYARRWGTRLPAPSRAKSKGGASARQRSSLATDISSRLQKRYPRVPRVLIDQIADAKTILMDRPYVEAKLRELQEQMTSQNLSLDAALSAAENVEGFHPRQVVNDLLSRDQFREILRGMYQIFDVGTPWDHGPHTHRLQWYVLYRAHSEGRLVVPPRLLYRVLGTEQFIDNDRRTIWDDVFDFDQEAEEIVGGSNKEAIDRAGYSSPEGGLYRLVSRSGPLRGGRLEVELRRIRLLSFEFGAGAILDPRGALILGILQAELMKNYNLNYEARERELNQMSTQALLVRYLECKPESPLKNISF